MLARLSTSPWAEEPDFVPALRAQMAYVLAHFRTPLPAAVWKDNGLGAWMLAK
jgi:hypothetical protein